MSDMKEIARITKNETSEIVISTTEWKGNMYVDIREHLSSEDYKGPTKKGIRFNIAVLKDIKNALNSIPELPESE